MEIDENEVLGNVVPKSAREGDTATSSAATIELPLARVKIIMQKGSDDLPVSQEGLFAMAKAAELFISGLTKNLYEAADSNCIEYSHLADFVQENDELDFLHDMIPRMVTFKEAVFMAKSANESAYADS